MARRCFYSFHYVPDNWRAAMVRNIGTIEGNKPASDNDWETVKKGGDAAIKKWISGQMYGRSCTVVLVGSQTADRKWINHEIIKSWDDGMGVVGIYVNGLKNNDGNTATKGNNPFDYIGYGDTEKNCRPLSNATIPRAQTAKSAMTGSPSICPMRSRRQSKFGRKTERLKSHHHARSGLADRPPASA